MSSGMPLDDWQGTWNEDEWEAFMTWADSCTARYERLLTNFVPGRVDLSALAKEMVEDDLFEGCDNPEGCSSCSDRDDCEFYLVVQLADMKRGSAPSIDDELAEKFSVLRRIPAYVAAHEFSIKLQESFGEMKTGSPACGAALEAASMVPAQIAGGHGIGYSKESICGNIANCKRALSSLELCLESVKELARQKHVPYVQVEALAKVGERVRSAVIQWIALLRHRAA